MGVTEGDPDAELVTVSVTVPDDAAVPELTPVTLLDAEEQALLEGVKLPVALSEGVTEEERHSEGVEDTEAVVRTVFEPTLVLEAEGDTEKENEVEPERVPVMLCVMVRDTESLAVIVGVTDHDSESDHDSVYMAEVEEEADALGLVEPEPEALGEPRADGEVELLPENVFRADTEKVAVEHGLVVGDPVLVGVCVVVRHRDEVGVMDSVEVADPVRTSDGEKVTEFEKDGVVHPEGESVCDTEKVSEAVPQAEMVAEPLGAPDVVADKVPVKDTVKDCVPVLDSVGDTEAEGEPESVAEPVEAPVCELKEEAVTLSDAATESVPECVDVAHVVEDTEGLVDAEKVADTVGVTVALALHVDAPVPEADAVAQTLGVGDAVAVGATEMVATDELVGRIVVPLTEALAEAEGAAEADPHIVFDTVKEATALGDRDTEALPEEEGQRVGVALGQHETVDVTEMVAEAEGEGLLLATVAVMAAEALPVTDPVLDTEELALSVKLPVAHPLTE